MALRFKSRLRIAGVRRLMPVCWGPEFLEGLLEELLSGAGGQLVDAGRW